MTDLSITQYNPYNMYQNIGYYPAFRGATIQQNNYNSVPQMTSQSDTVSFSANGQIQAETKKQGLSSGAKWGIGTIAVLGLGALAYVLTRGKAGSKQVQQLAEHIEFQEAKTMEEAIKFAKDKFNVVYTNNAQQNMPLELANIINKGLTQFNNAVKGKYRPANYIEYLSKDFLVDNEIDAIARATKVSANGNKLYGISFNPSYIENIDSKIKNTLNEWITNGALIKNGKNYQFEQANKTISISSELEKGITDYLSGKSFTLKEKMNLDTLMNDLYEANISLQKKYNGDLTQALGKTFNVYKTSPLHPVYHEIGHIYHDLNNPKTFLLMGKSSELKINNLSTSILDEFNSKYVETARKVSDYATESPAEFVAEVFAKMINGQKFDNDVMTLYKKYGGPSIS